MCLARIYVSPKPTVNDPEGLTILSSLGQLGYQNVSSVRSGKYIEVQIDEINELIFQIDKKYEDKIYEVVYPQSYLMKFEQFSSNIYSILF